MADVTDEARRRLVIVDDEPVILELLTTVFEGKDYEVVACEDGATALAAMEAGGVDVLLTDKNLPDISGLELLQHARRIQPDAEVIVITGFASLDTALSAMQLGAFDYIVKPPKSIFDVERKVAQAFSRQAILRENRRLVEHLRAKNEELEQALADVKRMQVELIQSEKLAGIGTLAAGVAHEISSPLFGVMGLAEAILEEDDLSLVRDYAREIVDYSRSIKEIVVDLSGYSRASAREYLTTVDLHRVIEDAVRLVSRSTGVEDGVVVVQGEPGVLLHAHTNELQQVFVNLVKNALEAVAEAGPLPQGAVTVRAWREGDEVCASVQDVGPGIPADVRRVVFDPFYTTKAPGKGTGLGLNIVYRIVTRHRGVIAVEGDGPGARFVMRLPADQPPD